MHLFDSHEEDISLTDWQHSSQSVCGVWALTSLPVAAPWRLQPAPTAKFNFHFTILIAASQTRLGAPHRNSSGNKTDFLFDPFNPTKNSVIKGCSCLTLLRFPVLQVWLPERPAERNCLCAPINVGTADRSRHKELAFRLRHDVQHSEDLNHRLMTRAEGHGSYKLKAGLRAHSSK